MQREEEGEGKLVKGCAKSRNGRSEAQIVEWAGQGAEKKSLESFVSSVHAIKLTKKLLFNDKVKSRKKRRKRWRERDRERGERIENYVKWEKNMQTKSTSKKFTCVWQIAQIYTHTHSHICVFSLKKAI